LPTGGIGQRDTHFFNASALAAVRMNRVADAARYALYCLPELYVFPTRVSLRIDIRTPTRWRFARVHRAKGAAT